MNRLVSILVLMSGIAFFSCKPKPVPPTPPTPVNLMTVTAQKVLYYDKYPATTVALKQVGLFAQVTGYITAMNFTEGTHVHKGQLLYNLDERLYESTVNQAKAALRVDSGNLRQVQQDFDRYNYLKEHNAVATQVVDHAAITLQNAKDSVMAAQQQLNTALTNLSYSNIYAPFDGTIGISQVRVGNLVSPGTTLLNTISQDDPIAVDFFINEAQLQHFEDLQAHKHGEIDSLFTIILPNGQVYSGLGKIAIIDRAVDPQTGTIDVRLAFPNPQNVLRAGMSAVVRVHNQDAAPQMVVPSRAVVEQMGEYFLFIAKDTILHSHSGDSAGKKGADTVEAPKLRAFQVKVQLGQTVGPNVIIRSGIHVGDRIIVDGVQALHEGSPINASNKQPVRNDSTGNREGDNTGHRAGDSTGHREGDSSKNK